jgi:hypothetical protein
MVRAYPQSWDAPANLREPLRSALIAAHQRTLAMSPEDKQAMFEAQRQSFIRALAPCEHGDPDWETCPECLAALRAQANREGEG